MKNFVSQEKSSGKSTNKVKEEGDLAELLELLDKLQPLVQKRKPKSTKNLIEKINNYSWPDDYSNDLAQLGKLISKYKFKNALVLLKSLLEALNLG